MRWKDVENELVVTIFGECRQSGVEKYINDWTVGAF